MNCKILRITVCVGILFVACNAMAQSPQDLNCQIYLPGMGFFPGGEVATMKVVNNGQSCGVDFYGMATAHKNPATQGVITSPPKHGHAEFIGPHVQYTPTSGYVGADEFSSKAWARDGSMVSRLLKVRMKVTVSAAQ